MKMMLTRQKVFEIHGALSALDQHARGFKLAYAIAKNLAKTKAEVAAVEKASKPSDKFTEYDSKRASMAASFAIKNDKDGEPLKVDNAYIIRDRAGFEKALRPLQDEYAEAIAEHEKRIKQRLNAMDDEVEIDLHQIKLELVEAEGAISEDVVGLGRMLEPLLGTVIIEEGS